MLARMLFCYWKSHPDEQPQCHHPSRLRGILIFFALSFGNVPLRAFPATPGDFVWLEGEAAQVNIKPNIAGWGNKHFLSGEKWLHVSVDANKIEKMVPAEGVLLKYPFSIKHAGTYEIWNRIGFEFVRSPFAWRIDDGDWKTDFSR